MPKVFKDDKPCAICAFIGSWMYLLMKKFGPEPDLALWSSATVITALRLASWRFEMRIGH
ncbi:hypothetical protein [Massilia sp. TSP1-1-2]|uniref:hypothetical protein n=1 Tax=unclassified Massilia TaxID=2609279 RepID=UPI003CF63FF4